MPKNELRFNLNLKTVQEEGRQAIMFCMLCEEGRETFLGSLAGNLGEDAEVRKLWLSFWQEAVRVLIEREGFVTEKATVVSAADMN